MTRGVSGCDIAPVRECREETRPKTPSLQPTDPSSSQLEKKTSLFTFVTTHGRAA